MIPHLLPQTHHRLNRLGGLGFNRAGMSNRIYTPAGVGRANTLRPASTLFMAASGTLAGLVIGLGAFVGLDIGYLLYTTTVAMSAISVLAGVWRLLLCAVPRRQPAAALPDDALPRYTVIIPLFREAHMVPDLVASMLCLDYPRDKLDIVFACEAVDPDTVDAARAVSTPPFRTVVVPPATPGGEPQTKPRALNAVLGDSHGELVTIYDAEDRPHPAQLRMAASAFAAHPDWAALQAPLDYFNTADSALAAQFGLEYATLFHVLLPGFDRMGLPFPLGGTSNHMRRDALEADGGWDPFNVTEDADLAFRLAATGGRIGWIAPPTQEEACYRLRPWFRQRSRWIKGYMQTWLVHMNAPFAGGWRRALMLQLTLGLSLVAITFYAPVILFMGLWALGGATGLVDTQMPPVFLGALGFSLFSGMVAGAVGACRSGQWRLLAHVPLMPLYWLLLFPPLLRALWELRTNPFHWHKTEHGVTGARPANLSPYPSPPAWTATPTSPSP